MIWNQRIKEQRLLNGITLKEVAARLGITEATAQRYESTIKSIPYDNIATLARLFGCSPAYLMGWEEKNESKGYKTVMIPRLTSVSCGGGVIADDNIEGYVDFPEELARTGEFFALTVKGDSMEPDLHDKDVVIVKQQPDAETGDLVIAKVNGDEGFCKRLKKYADGIALVSVNPSYEPMYFSEKQVKEEPVVVVGKVVEVRRKL